MVDEIHRGTTEEFVRETLGEPKGTVGSDAFRILYFDRGTVYLRNGLVDRTNLISEAQLNLRIRQEKEREEALRMAREAERETRQEERRRKIEAGKALRDEKLADSSFRDASPHHRLAFWRSFQRYYPEVDVSFHVDVARAELDELRKEQEWREEYEQERRALESRIRELEERAARAEEAVREHEQRSLQYPVVRHHAPIIIRSGQIDRDRRDHRSRDDSFRRDGRAGENRMRSEPEPGPREALRRQIAERSAEFQAEE